MEIKYKINLELINGLKLVHNEDIASIDNVIIALKSIDVESDISKIELLVTRKLVDNNRGALTAIHNLRYVYDKMYTITKDVNWSIGGSDIFLPIDLIPYMIKIDNTVYTTDEELANLIEEYKNALLDGSLIERAKNCNLIILDEKKI